MMGAKMKNSLKKAQADDVAARQKGVKTVHNAISVDNDLAVIYGPEYYKP